MLFPGSVLACALGIGKRSETKRASESEWSGTRARTRTHQQTERESEREGEEEEREKAHKLKIQIIGSGWRILEIITHKDQQSNIFLQWDKRDSSPIIEISPISCSTVSVEALVTLGEFP